MQEGGGNEKLFSSQTTFCNCTFYSIVPELEKICKDAVLIKRARHVIGEIERTRNAADALRKQDFEKVRSFFNFAWFLREIILRI